MPAATSAPKTTIRISSVSGSESISARWKSLPSLSSRALPIAAPPTSSTRRSGVVRPACCDRGEHRRDAIAARCRIALDRERRDRRVVVGRQLDARRAGRRRRRAPAASRRRGGRASRRRLAARRRRGGGSAPARSAAGSGSPRAVDDALGRAGVAAAAAARVHHGAARDAAGKAGDDEEEPESERPPGVMRAPVVQGEAVRVRCVMPPTLAGRRRPCHRTGERTRLAPTDEALSVAGANEAGLVRDDHGLRAVAALELREHVRDVRLDRVHGDDELVCDLLVRAAARDEPEDLGLALGQRGDQLGAAVARARAARCGAPRARA